MVARSKCSNQRPDTLMQERNRQLDENLLQRTAGPYIWVRFGRCRTALRWSAFPWCADVASRSSQSGTPGRCRRSSQAPPQSQRLPPWARCWAADLGGRYQGAIVLRIGAVYHPAVLLAFADGAGLEQNGGRPAFSVRVAWCLGTTINIE
jgi:hypothetical protein